MTLDRVIMAFAGTVIMVSLALSQFVDPRWMWLTAFVGFNLFQAAFTGFCPLSKILRRLGLQPSGGCAV